MTMQVIEFISRLAALALVLVGLAWWQYTKADEILQRWANGAGMQIVSAQRRYFRTGPFFMNQARGQFVYRIVVRDHSGTERAGWLKVGGLFVGVLSDESMVIWDS